MVTHNFVFIQKRNKQIIFYSTDYFVPSQLSFHLTILVNHNHNEGLTSKLIMFSFSMTMINYILTFDDEYTTRIENKTYNNYFYGQYTVMRGLRYFIPYCTQVFL